MPYLAYCDCCHKHFDFYSFLYNITDSDIKKQTVDNIELIVKCSMCSSSSPRRFTADQFRVILVGLREEYSF